MGDFFAFRTLVTSQVIQGVYAVGAVIITVVAIVVMVTSSTGVIIGVAALIFGNISWRLACEGTVVFFRIHDLLASIDDSMGVAEEDLSALSGRATTSE
jgi:hypothetical protein